MNCVTDKDRAELEAAQQALLDARKARVRVLARIRKRRERAKK